MRYELKVSRDGDLIFVAPITEMYAKIIALLGWAIPRRLSTFPQDAPILMGRMILTIEDAIQETELHSIWIALCAECGVAPIDVEVLGLSASAGKCFAHLDVGGGGGDGGWPAGGGGGGGGGLTVGGPGGSGAGGALVIFQRSSFGALVDVDVLVTPGEFNWVCPMGVEYVDTILIAGGGAGGSYGPVLPNKKLACRVAEAIRSDGI
jgi:hypothetical protein